jgi:hypothetical protein
MVVDLYFEDCPDCPEWWDFNYPTGLPELSEIEEIEDIEDLPF